MGSGENDLGGSCSASRRAGVQAAVGAYAMALLHPQKMPPKQQHQGSRPMSHVTCLLLVCACFSCHVCAPHRSRTVLGSMRYSDLLLILLHVKLTWIIHHGPSMRCQGIGIPLFHLIRLPYDYRACRGPFFLLPANSCNASTRISSGSSACRQLPAIEPVSPAPPCVYSRELELCSR